MPTPFNDRESGIVKAIREFMRRHDLAPMVRQIIEETHFKRHAVYYSLRRLEEKQAVIRHGRGRGVTLAEEFMPPPGVPIVGQIAAGSSILAQENINGYVSPRELFGRHDDVFLLRVEGDSMVDRHILPGDLIVVDPHEEVRQYDVAAVLAEGEAMVKTVTWTGFQLTLLSANAQREYRPRHYGPDDNVRVLGRVIAALRKL